MMQFITVTSQGQITIPAAFRRALGINKNKKLFATIEGDKLVMKPEADIMSLAGSLSKYAMKGKSIDEIIKIEEEAWGNAVEEKYKKFKNKK